MIFLKKEICQDLKKDSTKSLKKISTFLQMVQVGG
jgi:hypothetical protein